MYEYLLNFFLGKERRMAEQVATLLDEKCEVLETLSQCQQEVSAHARLVTGCCLGAQRTS